MGLTHCRSFLLVPTYAGPQASGSQERLNLRLRPWNCYRLGSLERQGFHIDNANSAATKLKQRIESGEQIRVLVWRDFMESVVEDDQIRWRFHFLPVQVPGK